MEKQEVYDMAKELTMKGLLHVETLSKQAMDKYKEVRQMNENVDEHCGVAFGAILTLFGGQFATTYAFVEAFQQTGHVQELVDNLQIIRGQLQLAEQAVIEDDSETGMTALPQREFVERKVQVFVQSVDPEVVKRVFTALWLSFLNAGAAVKLKFATVIALGASVGEFLERPAQKYLFPWLKKQVDEKYHRWLPTLISYFCRLVGISLAFRLNRVLATISTSIRGSDMILRNINALCMKRNLPFLTNSPADELLAFSVVGVGVYAQLFGPQASSSVVRVLLFPLTISEKLLTLWVAS